MRWTRWPLGLAPLALMLTPAAMAQQAAPANSVEAIDGAFETARTALEVRRLESLAALAATQPADQAARTNEHLLRMAVNGDLYRQAEPFADQILARGDAPALVSFYASLVNLIAEADRGAFDEASRDLRAAIDIAKTKAGRSSEYPPSSIVTTLCEAYYQRLLRAGRLDVARRDFALALSAASDPVVVDYLKGRLERLEMVGKPAPALAGPDLDGKNVSLADFKGEAVLVVFWTTWQLSNAEDVRSIRDALATYQAKGLKVIGVNLDALQAGNDDPAKVLALVRRYALDNNVTWPTLINGEGPKNHAAAYHVAEVPANVLIGRDGNVLDLDLTRQTMTGSISKALEAR
ncbi:TlpA disulfide reductase family protein [Isosphaeraceae bacterium EP7]